MTAEHGAPCFPRFGDAAAQNRGDCFGGYFLVRSADDVERSERAATHRKNVRERVGGGNFAVLKRIIDNRGEEIDGLHKSARAVESVNAGVIGRGGTDENVAIAGER